MRSVRAGLGLLLVSSLLGVGGSAGAAVPIVADGVIHAGIYSSEWDASVDLDGLASWAGKRVTFSGIFHDVMESAAPAWSGNTDWKLEEAWQAQSTPFSNLTINSNAAQIAAGARDSDIAAWADKVQAWLDRGGGRSVIIAPLQEMNGDWVPYGMDPANFKVAYKRIVDTFRARGLDETKVRWAFAPNGWSTPPYKIADYYPGDAYVDVIGISAYNFGSIVGSWETVSQVFDPWLNELRTTVTADKPYLIAQTASSSSGGDKDAWLREMFTHLAADPNVFGLVYFNLATITDFPVWNGSSGNAGFRDGMGYATTAYQWPLDNWFELGALPFSAPVIEPICPDGIDCDSVIFQTAGGKFFLHEPIGMVSTSFFYGNPGDVAFMGDWNCNGERTPGLYRQSDGFVYLRNTNSQGVADTTFFFGNPGDFPLAGDFNGDGCDTVSIYRPGSAQIFIINALGVDGGGLGAADYSYFFGNPGDKPFVGDFDGDGIDTVGLHRESTGFVYFRNTNTQGNADFEFFFGDPGDRLLAGDWDGDGDDTVAVYRPSNGTLYLKNSNSAGIADHTIPVGTYVNALRAS